VWGCRPHPAWGYAPNPIFNNDRVFSTKKQSAVNGYFRDGG